MGSLPLHEQEEIDQEIGLFEETSKVINLASKEEQEQAFWTGLTNGFGPPGFSLNDFYDVDQEWEESWYQDDLTLSGTTVPGQNTDEQFAYNLGYLTSMFGFGMVMYGVGVYAGAQAGFATTLGVNALYWTAQGASAATQFTGGAALLVAAYYGHQATLGSPGVTLGTVDTSGGHGHGGGSSYTAVPSVGIAGWILSWFE